jgi:hypothetical protein
MQASRETGTTRVPDMDTDLFSGIFSIYLVGGGMAFLVYALFRTINIK